MLAHFPSPVIKLGRAVNDPSRFQAGIAHDTGGQVTTSQEFRGR